MRQPFSPHGCWVRLLPALAPCAARAPAAPAPLACVPFCFQQGGRSSHAGLGSILTPVLAIATPRVSLMGIPLPPLLARVATALKIV